MTFYTIYKIVLFAIIPCFSVYLFFNTVVKFKRMRRKLSKWSSFNQQLLKWAEEIVDTQIKSEYLSYAASFVVGSSNMAVNKSSEIDVYRKYIYEKYGDHIPSIKSEIRAEKLKKLI